jgi:hypothetical protein
VKLAPVVASTVLVALLSACGPVPGGRLEGVVTPRPPEWSSVLDDGRAFCEIESRPEDPHSIQLDCFLYERDLYVQSHRWAFASWWPTESWASVWVEHPEVRLRIGDALFELRAVHVTEPTERTPVLEARGYNPVPDGIALFRFDAHGRDT